MNCVDINKILLEEYFDELPVQIKMKIDEHISICSECASVFNKIIRADKIICDLKNSEPVFAFEDMLTESIMNEVDFKKQTFFQKLIDSVVISMQKPTIKFAFSVVLIILSSLYIYQEYDAVVKINALEKKYSSILYSKAQVFSKTAESAAWLYQFYKYFSAEKDFVQVTDKMIIIRKEQLADLMKDFNSLNDAQKKKIIDLRKELFPDEKGLMNKEIKIDKKEVGKKISLLNSK